MIIFFFQQLSPELLVYEDYNYSTAKPTPAYGKTSEYSGENGVNDITPAKDSNDNTGTPIDSNIAKKGNDNIITNIDAILADSKQTITPGPYVVVHTTLLMHIPISINLFGWKMFAGNVEGNSQLFQMQSTYTFPITNTYVAL